MKGLITAEIFDNFMEMAEHLLDNKYKDAAAVIIDSVLESHLRELCDKHSIPTTETNSNGKVKPKKQIK